MLELKIVDNATVQKESLPWSFLGGPKVHEFKLAVDILALDLLVINQTVSILINKFCVIPASPNAVGINFQPEKKRKKKV